MEAPMTWPEFGWEPELVREILRNDVVHHEQTSLLSPQPLDSSVNTSSDDRQSASSSSSSSSSCESNDRDQILVNPRPITTAYSGPTLSDIANALSVTSGNPLPQEFSNPRISMLDKGLSKVENKYTIKISDNGVTDDGYKWRKYGQKSIKNSPNPRSYYKCANPRCGAKKQVERSIEDPDTLIITYEGLHLHFAYPYFLPTQQGNVPFKKQKRPFLLAQEEEETNIFPKTTSDNQVITRETFVDSFRQRSINGLLEDVVPVEVRIPSNDTITSISSSTSCYE